MTTPYRPPGSDQPAPPSTWTPGPERQRPAPNPLGLAALVVGAIGPLLGVLFLLIQAAALGSGGTDAFQLIGTAHSVLSGLISIAALILGLVAITRPGRSKTLAAAGIALGAAGLVEVLGSLLYGAVLSLVY